jgi:hypothetical protein
MVTIFHLMFKKEVCCISHFSVAVGITRHVARNAVFATVATSAVSDSERSTGKLISSQVLVGDLISHRISTQLKDDQEGG